MYRVNSRKLAAGPSKLDVRRETGDLLVIFAVDVRQHRVFPLGTRALADHWYCEGSGRDSYGGDLLGEVDILGDGLLPAQGTLLVNVLHLLAQIRALVDQAYQAVLDGQVDVCALLDFLGEVAFGFDGQSFAAAATDKRRHVEGDGKLGRTYGEGGLGVRSTLVMVRVYLSSFWQNSSGLAPGTLRSSSRTRWSPRKKDSELEAAEEARSRAGRMPRNFMILLYLVGVDERRK